MRDYKIKESIVNLQQNFQNLKKSFEDLKMGFEAMIDVLSEKFDGPADDDEAKENAGV